MTIAGVSLAGFTTTEHPVESACAILRPAIMAGMFQGAIASTGPIGSW